MNNLKLMPVLTVMGVLMLMPHTAQAQCIIFCGFNTEEPLESTQVTGLYLWVTSATTVGTSQGSTESTKKTFTAREKESARYYIASDGAIEDVHFTSAMSRLNEEAPNTGLSKVDVAMLISRQSD
ncbi:hypothetical protein [Pseudomonas huanghezhanensis]|uniref:hypothetical protein n=1 Tax=Pseudomonas huanghezhanensis TaxID=3002903 RepID=UPI002285B5F4|nr:hypothetical protein [Pseudomonas sp. BSw22131]